MEAAASSEKVQRAYTRLPIDAARGFPQAFPFFFGGRTYHFLLYVNVAWHRLEESGAFLEMATEEAYLVARVEAEGAGGQRETIFLGKVLPEPGRAYEAGEIALRFPVQRIARQNLNGQGEFGSKVDGEIAARWA